MKVLISLSIFILFPIFLFMPAEAQWSDPVPVDSINTSDMHDFYPSISSDGQSMYLANGNRLTISHWNGTSWGTPIDLGNNINSGQRQVKATVMPDNHTLYFTSYKAGGYGSYDIWKSEWQDTCQCWGVATVLPPPLNSERMEWDVQLSHDGRKLYISSDRYFGWGYTDIWCSDWNDSTQEWGEPQNLGPTVNSSNDDYGAYPSTDGSMLYFCSWGWHGLGPVDLVVAFNRGGVWDSIYLLPPPIMTGYWEESPAISDDGSTLYFASTRPGGPGWTDIYVTHNTTDIKERESGEILDKRELDIYPNPANGETIFSFSGEGISDYNIISIYDISGRKVSSIDFSGKQSVIWDFRDSKGQKLPSGIYFALWKTAQECISKKVILLK